MFYNIKMNFCFFFEQIPYIRCRLNSRCTQPTAIHSNANIFYYFFWQDSF